MSEHPIEGLMKTAMNSIESLVDVNTIVGESIVVEESGIVIIPISKVCFGFAAGGSEFCDETMSGYKKHDKEETAEYKLPFGGGRGAAVNIKPVAFITIIGDTVKINPIEHASTLDKLIDYIPDFMKKLNIDSEKLLEKYNLKDKNKKEFDFELSKKNSCNCVNKQKEHNNNDDKNQDKTNKEDNNFEEEKSKVKSVSSIVSTKGPITKKKVKVEYEDDEENVNTSEDFGLEEDESQIDDNM